MIFNNICVLGWAPSISPCFWNVTFFCGVYQAKKGARLRRAERGRAPSWWRSRYSPAANPSWSLSLQQIWDGRQLQFTSAQAEFANYHPNSKSILTSDFPLRTTHYSHVTGASAMCIQCVAFLHTALVAHVSEWLLPGVEVGTWDLEAFHRPNSAALSCVLQLRMLTSPRVLALRSGPCCQCSTRHLAVRMSQNSGCQCDRDGTIPCMVLQKLANSDSHLP